MNGWNRQIVRRELAPRLWNYLAGHSLYARVDQFLDVNLCIPSGSTNRLVASKLLNPDIVEPALSAIEACLPSLRSSTRSVLSELSGQVVGRVNWPTTVVRRIATANPLLISTGVVGRAYDTWESRVLFFVIDSLQRLIAAADYQGQGLQVSAVGSYHARCMRLRQHSKLRQARRLTSVPLKSIQRLSRNPNFGGLSAFINDYQSAYVSQNPIDMARVLGSSILEPVDDDKLYELLVGFRLMDALADLGYSERGLHIRGLQREPFAVLDHPSRGRIVIRRETSVFDIAEFQLEPSQFADICEYASVPKSRLRPDYVLEFEHRPPLIVEVKHSLRQSTSRDREGIRDALTYLMDAHSIFGDFAGVAALVVAYGSKGTPNSDARVMVCDENRLSSALSGVIGG